MQFCWDSTFQGAGSPGFDAQLTLSVVVQTCNFNPREIEARGSEVQVHPLLHKEIEARELERE